MMKCWRRAAGDSECLAPAGGARTQIGCRSPGRGRVATLHGDQRLPPKGERVAISGSPRPTRVVAPDSWFHRASWEPIGNPLFLIPPRRRGGGRTAGPDRAWRNGNCAAPPAPVRPAAGVGNRDELLHMRVSLLSGPRRTNHQKASDISRFFCYFGWCRLEVGDG